MSTRKKAKNEARGESFFARNIDRFCSFIYSLFTNSAAGTWLSNNDNIYKKSKYAKRVEKTAVSVRTELSKSAETVMEQSKAVKAFKAFKVFLSSLSLNVYGVFFLTYGLSSMFMYYITILLNGKNDFGRSSLLTALVMAVCSIPLIMSSGAATEIMAGSKIMRKLITSFFVIPEEKLKQRKRIGGTEYMVMAVMIALLCGVLTYFLHSAYVLFLLGLVILLCVIWSNPEAGIMLTVAATPFLQYVDFSEVVLAVMITVTGISYVMKLSRHRRTLTFSSEAVVIIIFCGFLLVASAFSRGGLRTLYDGAISVIIILGGFLMTFNLMHGEKRISLCVKALSGAFMLLCVFGIFSVAYNGIAGGAMYAMKEYIQPIMEGRNLYIADSASVFGVMAVLISPLIFAYIARQKSVRGVAAVLGFMTIVMIAAFVYGTYETIMAIIIEFCAFWLMYSRKTLKVVIYSIVPIAIAMLVYSGLANQFGLPSIMEAINSLLPLGFAESSTHLNVVEDSFAMLMNGNLSGIGVGKHAFKSVFPAYSDVVSAGADIPGMFVLQLVCWSGVGGLLAFTGFVFILMKRSLGSLIVMRHRTLRCETLALVCGIGGALIYGSVNCLWSDMRMLYLFWVCAGLLAGCVREGREREAARLADFSNDYDSADVELKFYK